MELEPASSIGTEGWREVTVEDLKATSASALATGPFGSSIGSRFFQQDGIPVIRGSNLSDDTGIRLSDDGLVFVSLGKANEFKRSIVRKGDLIFTCWGTINQIGLIDDQSKYSEYVISNKQMKLTPDLNKADSLFLYYLFSGPEVQHVIKRQSIGSSVPGFNLGQLRAMRLTVPPLPEQHAIAAVLSDVDALITALDKLIAKKRDIKKAAMQQLLTGTTRRPGFNGEWGVKNMGAIGSTFGGLTGKSKRDFEGGNARYIPFLNAISNPVIDVDDLDWVSMKPGEKQNRAQCGDLFFNTSSETPDEVGMGSALLQEIPGLYLNSFCFGFRLFDLSQVFPLFVVYYFRSSYGRESMSALAQGSTRYNLSKVSFLKLGVSMPSWSEQRDIAAVLSDMDAEITALERRRDKTRALKQGMMQELLTGRIRLI